MKSLSSHINTYKMKKKTTLSLFVLVLISVFNVSAQETIIGDLNYNLLVKYIESAKESFPRRKIFETKAVALKTAIPMNALSYLDIFNASYFYRPDNSNLGSVGTNPDGSTVNNISFNGFQFGVNVNLGNFLQKPYMGKRAKAEYNVAKLEAQEYETTLTVEVKKRYYTYIQQLSLLKINTQSVQDNRNVADNLKSKFERGQIALDTYNQSRINLAAAETAKLETEVNLLVAKDALEEIVGKPLSDFK